MDEYIVEVEHLSKLYHWEKKSKGPFSFFKNTFHPQIQEVRALDDLSLKILPGEVVGFLGPNGAGKSTTFKCICGILKPDCGTVKVMNRDSWHKRKEIAPYLGAYFGSKSLMWWNLPIIKSFELMKEIYRISDKQYRENLKFLTDVIAIGAYLEKPPRQLSFGQRAKAEIVACLLHNPKLVILDEPTIGLDILAKESLINMIVENAKAFQTTFLISTHDLKDIENICSRILIINHGQLLKESSSENIREELASRYTITIDFEVPFSIADLAHIPLTKRQITNRRLEIDVDAKAFNPYSLLENINHIQQVSYFELQYQTIEEVLRQYYI